MPPTQFMRTSGTPAKGAKESRTVHKIRLCQSSESYIEKEVNAIETTFFWKYTQ